MKSDLEQLPWVKSATVSRSYLPNLLKITLKERRVRSLWQINNAFYPIDTDGAVIRADFVPSRPVLLIVGRGAPEHLNELLTAVEDDNEVFPGSKSPTSFPAAAGTSSWTTSKTASPSSCRPKTWTKHGKIAKIEQNPGTS